MELYYNPKRYVSLPLGVVIRRTPGATRWAKWSWRVSGILVAASEAKAQILRQDGEVIEYHAATVPLELHGADTESYMVAISAQVPSIYVVMRDNPDNTPPFEVILATASAYEAQDYADSGEEIVEKVMMPEGVVAWVRDFVKAHHVEQTFIKRKRDKKRVDLSEDGIGDVRIAQTGDVYRAPSQIKKERLS
ncbi:MAG: DUF3305 domain-containing protein [Paracoccaceae bacterium]